MESVKVQGKLMAIGGGEDKEKDCLILKEFVRLAGGDKAKIVVMTTATDLPEEVGDEYIDVFNRLGVKQVRHVDVSERSDAAKPESIEAVRQASGLYFTGGDQLHITSLMGGTALQEAILARYKKDLIVAGTSAGAAMMGDSMIVSGESSENPCFGSVQMSPGADLIDGCLIDTHFSQRGRHGRMMAAIAHFPQAFGFGVDENTAMIIDRGKFTVLGEGSVTVFDGGGITYTDLPYVKEGQGVTLGGVKLHVLSEGSKFDFKTRQIIPPRTQHKAGIATASESGKATSKKQKGRISK